MSNILVNLLLAMAAIAIVYKAAAISLKGIVSIVSLSAVIVALAPGAYAAAKAEMALPVRDLALDYEGNAKDAKLFDTIVKDRVARTRVAAQHGEKAWRATNFGRKFA
jgi:hypothetical protein